MKKLPFLIFFFYFLLECNFVFSRQLRHPYSEDGLFLVVYGQMGGIFWDQQPGQFSVSFPYTINYDSSPAFHGTFSSTKNNLIGTGRFFYSFPAIEFGKNNFSLDANYSLGGPTPNWTDNFYFGMNYRLHFGGLQDNPDRLCLAGINLPGSNLQRGLSPYFIGISAGVEFYHPLFELGNISTDNGEISLPGGRMKSDDGNVIVYFQQNVTAFVPAISLERFFGNNLSISLRAAPLIPIAEKGGLRYSYMGEDSDHDEQIRYFVPNGAHLDFIPMNTYSVNARFNDAPLQQTPFHLCDWMFSFRINFVLK